MSEIRYRNVIGVRIDDETNEKLITVALARKQRLSELVREILEDYLK